MTAINPSPAAKTNPTPATNDSADGPVPGDALYATWAAIPGEIARLAKERAEAEDSCRTIHAARIRRADLARREAIDAANRRREAETAELARELAAIRQEATREFTTESEAAESERVTLRKTAIARHRRRHDEATRTHEAARWEAGTIFENAERGANDWRKESLALLADETQSVKVLRAETDLVLTSYGRFTPPLPPVADEASATETIEGDPFPALHASIESADAGLVTLEKLGLPGAFRGSRILWVYLLPLLALAYPSWLLLPRPYGAIGGVLLALGIGFALQRWITRVSRTRIAAARAPLLASLDRAEDLIAQCGIFVASVHRQRVAEATTRRDTEFGKADRAKEAIIEEALKARDEKIRTAEEDAASRIAEARSRLDQIMRQAAETERHRGEEIVAQHAADLSAAEAAYKKAIEDAESNRRTAWQDLAEAWSGGMRRVTDQAAAIHRAMDERYPDWTRSPLPRWTPQDMLPEAIRIGDVHVALDRIPNGVSDDKRLRAMAPDAVRLPALLDFPERSSIAFEFSGEEGRKKAVDAMQAVMLRYATGLPAAKVRFTILDPVGLGRDFAGFMHLADYAEALVNTRIWTEPQQIDQRLAELNLHIETVIQNYLRNEFPTIEAYNAQAAEVAEPYRVLVVSDFPAGFSEPTAKRLAAIAKSGPRCGVYLILGLDKSQPLPPNLTRDELTKTAVRATWRDGRFVLRNPIFETFATTIDEPPPADAMTRLLHQIGEAAREANRVEVPFEVIAPKPEDYWTGDSGSSLSVPLGRSGATKLQSLKLGKGTSQHVLIAGRTGSGKSTLLHALITNAALIYGPDEVELYLIDFKKGVEFKTYATHGLPHARVVAIESEREFGLSVLQRLDAELKVRGDIFRDLGVQDLAGYRAAAPGTPMPRLLLIVDEFQEFFVEDDKLAQEASLLLDRLVRQGRAFGIHVNLGSQTLSGAYSLARSTLGQMAVRIALQCSEADAHLILNEDNAAARLLSRPGEAIYNDANGQVEGNHIFQVVFLTDAKREAYLKSLAQLARDRNITPRSQIVFEGNRPSDLTKHPIFSAADRPAARAGVVYAWLGEAVAIKDPTAAPFRAQGGSNLLIIGQNDEMAVGLATASVLGLSRQLGEDSKFYVLDGTPEDSPFWGRLGKLADMVTQPLRAGGPRDTAAILSEVAAEVERRQANPSETTPLFLVIHDLPRFRDLRKQDDDFSFGRRGEEKVVSPAKAFGTILREGPALGVHLVVWCDSLNNANRAFDRQMFREFEMRVLFQMSPADSSNLIDSPAANRLGENRAYFSSEEAGKLEKFRPYGLPSPEWLESLRTGRDPSS